MAAPSALRDDASLVSHAVAELARRTHFPVAFGGLEHNGAVHVTTIVGARTRHAAGRSRGALPTLDAAIRHPVTRAPPGRPAW